MPRRRRASASLCVQTFMPGATATGLTFTTESQAQGAVTLSNGQETNAILMWSKGKVPPVRVPIEHERY